MKKRIMKSVVSSLCILSLAFALSSCVAYGPVYYHHGYWYPGGGVYVY